MKKQKTMSINPLSKSFSGANRQGFTLIELLLVMAIVGILAGTILVGVSGQREKARAGRALESMNSVLPYAVECYINSTAMNAPVAAGGNVLCGAVSYPSLGDGCDYDVTIDPDMGSFEADCGVHNIICDVDGAGNCLLTTS